MLILQEIPERPKRKSVAFSEDTKVVDSNGDVTTEMNGTADRSTAESHSSMPTLGTRFLLLI